MDDKRLLELAAVAAGVGKPDSFAADGTYIFREPHKPNWNPLYKSGDAFDLSVGLDLEVYHSDDDGVPIVIVGYPNGEERIVYAIESHSGEYFSKIYATRRAITRAAAAIAESQQ